MMRLELATAEYIGARAQQQDLAAAVPLPAGAVLVLADGLGGHESGADASRIVVETFREASQGGRFNNQETRRHALRETVERANARIGEGVDPSHGHRGMASTVVAAVVANGEVSWVSVGDSHLYLWRGGRLHKLNEDHSQAGLMVRSGQYKPGDPEVQAVKSVLVSALTGRKLELVDLPQKGFKIEPGDVLVLASDGLNTLDDDEIEGIVGEVRTSGAAKLSTTLLERVRSRRVERQDNATVAIARVLEPAAPKVEPKPAVAPPMPAAPAIDLDAEERTERYVPPPSAAETAEQPEKTPAPAEPAKAVAEPSKAPSPVTEAGAPTAEPEAKTPEPPKKPLDIVKPAPAPEAATAQPADGLMQAAAAGAALPATATAAAPMPAMAEAEPSRAPSGNGARVSLPRAPVASSPRALPPRIELHAPSEASTQPVDSLAPPPLQLPRPSWKRLLATVLLVWMIAVGVAVAAIAALKPEWLSGIVPGFSSSGSSSAPAKDATVPASLPVQAPVKSAPPATPTTVPVPVPATRPSTTEPAKPEASGEATKAPAGPAPAEETQRAPPAAAVDPAAAKQGEPAVNSTPAPSAPGGAQTRPTPSETPVDQSTTLQAAPATTAEPQLVEPQQPAARPSQQGTRARRNNGSPQTPGPAPVPGPPASTSGN